MDNRVQKLPEVNPVAEFSEISLDFRNPRDAVREAISNAFDAGASTIKIQARMEKYRGDDELVLEFEDDGEGLQPEGDKLTPSLSSFFGLGQSTRRGDDNTIGTKGHGTKTYFNSREIELWTHRGDTFTYALMVEPKRHLADGEIPPYEYEIRAATDSDFKGTKIILRGYNRNRYAGFSHEELRDFIFWFTKFGSVETQLGIDRHQGRQLSLLGLPKTEAELLIFGHPFAQENFDIKKLRLKDPASPTKYFVKKWTERDVRVKGFPHHSLDIVFYIEGDRAKDYNPMVRRPGRSVREGMYSVEERYGLWACKDYIPIQPITDWIAGGQRVGTKFHAFINSKAFQLTANRGDIGNTPDDLLSAIKTTTVEWFEEHVKSDKIYRLYEEELERESTYKEPKQEEEDFKRRRQAASKKKIHIAANKRLFTPGTVELIEPRQEVGVIALFYMLYALNPSLFGWKIVDYDTRKGYDALAIVPLDNDIDKETYRFIEFKKTLEKDFDHSFRRLGGIVCWDCNLANGDQVRDIRDETRALKIVRHTAKNALTQFTLVSDTESHNIRVLVLKDFLKERNNIEFRTRTAAD